MKSSGLSRARIIDARARRFRNTDLEALLTYLSTYLLNYSIQHSSSWEANRFSANQEIPRILWNQKVHYRIHMFPPPVAILSQLDPVRALLAKLIFYSNGWKLFWRQHPVQQEFHRAVCSDSQFLGTCAELRKAAVTLSCFYVGMEQLGFHWWIFMKFDIWLFFENLLRKFKFH